MVLVFVVNCIYFEVYAATALSRGCLHFGGSQLTVINNTVIITQVNTIFTQSIADATFVVVRVLIPFFIMVTLNAILIRYITLSKKKIATKTKDSKQKKESRFTTSIILINAFFFIFQFPEVVKQILRYSYFIPYANSIWIVANSSFTLFGNITLLWSYCFTLLEFFLDITFNSLFRAEILSVFDFILKRKTPTNSEQKSRTK